MTKKKKGTPSKSQQLAPPEPKTPPPPAHLSSAFGDIAPERAEPVNEEEIIDAQLQKHNLVRVQIPKVRPMLILPSNGSHAVLAGWGVPVSRDVRYAVLHTNTA